MQEERTLEQETSGEMGGNGFLLASGTKAPDIEMLDLEGM